MNKARIKQIQSLTKNNCRHIDSLRCYADHRPNVGGKVQRSVLANQNRESADVRSSGSYKDISVRKRGSYLALIGCMLIIISGQG